MSAMELTGQAGEILGVDPGRPGVPDFGRRIYHVTSLLLQSQGVSGMTPSLRKAAARSRVAGLSGLAEERAGAEPAFRERGSYTGVTGHVAGIAEERAGGRRI